MTWQELSIKVPREYVEPIAYLFGRYGRGFSMENAGDQLVLLRTYLPDTSRQRLARIQVGANLVRILQPMAELTVKSLEEADWESAWKAHFSLLKVGKRLVIKPTWIDYDAGRDELIIELDPGMAFGTGYHPTTRMCLKALEELVRPGMEVLDLGTGSGILSIAAARLGASYILALDTDATAVKAARKNFRTAGLTSTVRLARGSLPHNQSQDGRFDLAVANITGKVIQGSAPHLRQALKPGGLLIASGFLQTQQAELEGVLVGAGFSRLRKYKAEDWAALLMSRTK